MAFSTSLIIQVFLVLIIVIFYAQQVKGDSSAINLDVFKPDGQSHVHMVVNCSIDSNLPGLETLASLAVYGSKPYGRHGEFDRLAVLDMWSLNPTLASELEDSDVSVTGNLSPKQDPYLVISWNSQTNLYRDSFKCVANGIDEGGKAKSINTIVQLNVGSEQCSQSNQHLSVQIQELSSQYEVLANTSHDALKEVSLLNAKFDQIEDKLNAINLRTRVHSTLLAIDLTKFDVSDIYKERVYLASKQEKNFNLPTANAACQAAGGYLLEIDDNEENKFAFDFAKRIGGSDHFALGGNDLEREGRFIYFNSKKPVPDHVTWMRDRPNNAGGKEHCMEIWLSQGGLNDIPCASKVKFICEIPLRF